MAKTAHIALIPCPGVSHLVPFVEFAKRFVHLHHDFHVTFIVPTLENFLEVTRNVLATLPSNVDFVLLPVNQRDLPQATWGGMNLINAVSASLPSLRDILKSMTAKSSLAALVLDFFSIEVINIAKEFQIPPYLFLTVGATTLSLLFHMRKLEETTAGDLIEADEPIRMPGCVSVRGRDLPDQLLNKSSIAYRKFLQIGDRLRLMDGILVNTFEELERGPIEALKSYEAPIYPVGPIIQTSSSVIKQEGLECLRWLDSQPQKSVLYVSFGSGGTLSQDQLVELANGLELSGQKFIWVARPPSQTANGAYFGGVNEDPDRYLPQGFLERTKERGLVIPSWAPQIEILSHESTAGFLSHCGWSSTLESIFQGVPMIAWPLYAEQKLNAVLLKDDLKVAIRPKANDNGTVESEEIANVINSLVEGEEGKVIRERMKLLKDAASNALKEDGSSRSALSNIALKWKNARGQI